MPFFDIGGMLADDEETEKALLLEAIKLAQDMNKNHLLISPGRAYFTGESKFHQEVVIEC